MEKETLEILDQKFLKQKEAMDKAVKDAEQAFEKKAVELKEELAAKDATIGQIREELNQLKETNTTLQTKQKEAKGVKAQVADFIKEKGEDFVHELATMKSGIGKGMSLKAVADMTSANLTGDQFHSYLNTDAGQRPLGQTRFRDLVRTFQSATDYVQFVRAATPPGEGSFARQATEGAVKNKVDYDWAMIDVTLTPIAGYANVSRQSLRNIPFLQSYLPTTMLEDLLDTEDTLFSTSLYAAATGSTTSTGSNEIEKIVHYIRNLSKGKFKANGIAVDPDVWSDIILTTQTNAGYNLPNVVTVDTNGTVRILGRPVYEVNWLNSGKVIVGDWTKTAILESEGLRFAQTDSHDTNFTKNILTFLLERTEEIAVFRPDAFIANVI